MNEQMKNMPGRSLLMLSSPRCVTVYRLLGSLLLKDLIIAKDLE
jgi:hypothetical protein